MIFEENSKVILINLHKKGDSNEDPQAEAILMSTHNIGFYEEISKIIF